MAGLATRAVVAVALVGVAAAQAGKNCFEKYQCIFHHDVNGQELSWDLHQLCHEDFDYTMADQSGHTTHFKICGNASQTCAPGYETYDTHGVAVQIFDTDFLPCNSTNNGCIDYDYNVSTCCTGDCYILVRDPIRVCRPPASIHPSASLPPCFPLLRVCRARNFSSFTSWTSATRGWESSSSTRACLRCASVLRVAVCRCLSCTRLPVRILAACLTSTNAPLTRRRSSRPSASSRSRFSATAPSRQTSVRRRDESAGAR